jgi:hypothetical protein
VTPQLSTAFANPQALGGAPNTAQSTTVAHVGMHTVEPAKATHSATPNSQSLTFAQGTVQYPNEQNPLAHSSPLMHGR